MKLAMYWQRIKGDQIHCYLCPHNCLIPQGGTGRCRVRQNRGGELLSLNYGVLSGIALDPMEKKPLYHFCPGSLVLSVGSRGCNLACGFCQNWTSVQGEVPLQTISVGELVQLAEASRPRGNCGVAFTYTEPLMWYEFVQEAAALIQQRGMGTVLVTNGFIEPEPWQQLLPNIDAVNIDLKAFTPEFYRKNCGGRLKPVQAAIAGAVGKCHVEITTLLIEGHNTDPKEIEELSAFLADLDPDIPLHLSRYYPAKAWRQPATDPDLIQKLAAIARQRLNYVYTGNLPDSWQAETRCPQCNGLLVKRGLEVRVNLAQGHCPYCQHPANIQLNCTKE